MALVVESTSTEAWSSTFSLSIDKPTGLSVGDLMVAHVASGRSDGVGSIPSGWTAINESASALSIFSGTYYKIATSGDVAASNFQWSYDGGSNQGQMAGIIYRISGHDASSPIGDDNSAEDETATNPQSYAITVTPTIPNSLLVITMSMVGDAVNITDYAIATSDPSWTEGYNETTTSDSDYTAASAYATRLETTATGDVTLTGFSAAGDEDSICQIVVIKPAPTNVTVNPATLGLSMTIGSVDIAATVVTDVVNMSYSIPAPMVTTQTVDWDYENRPAESIWTIESQ